MNFSHRSALPNRHDTTHSWIVPVVEIGAGRCHFREDFMRRPLLLIAAVTIAACGGSTSPSQPASPYNIAVVGTPTHSGGGGFVYVTRIVLQATDTGTGTPHAGVGVTLQVDGGQITSPLPNITDNAGLTSVTWSIDTSFQHPGSSYALGFCAVPPGKSFCKTSLIGANVVTAQF
jgi:hypothetical protein